MKNKDDSDYSSKSSFESRKKAINKIKVVQTDDEESFNEESYDEDFDAEKKSKNRHNSKKAKCVNENSRTRKIKTSHKKDDWNDDESKDESMSSCDPDSDDNDKSEKNQKITINQDDEIIEFFNSVTVDQIKSLSNISHTKIENFIKLRPFKDSSDMVIIYNLNFLN
jgi:hypothetical protein